jgi:hypothetical protein
MLRTFETLLPRLAEGPPAGAARATFSTNADQQQEAALEGDKPHIAAPLSVLLQAGCCLCDCCSGLQPSHTLLVCSVQPLLHYQQYVDFAPPTVAQRFDEAWVAYLEQFVAWKSADAGAQL